MLEYCYDDDGYSMNQQESYHSMQMQDDQYHHSPHAGMPMKPPASPQYSKPMMYNGNYGFHQDGFPGKNNYPNSNGNFYGQSMHQSGYSGSGAGTNGYYMSHASMGGKPPYNHSMNAAQFAHSGGGGGGGGYNTMMLSSSSDHQYDHNYNKIRPRPMRMQSAAATGYEHGNWGNTNDYHYNNQIVNCMPYGCNHNEDQWLSRSLGN